MLLSVNNTQNKKVLLLNFDKRWGGVQEYLINCGHFLLSQNYIITQLIKSNSMSSCKLSTEFAEFTKDSQYNLIEFDIKSLIHSLWTHNIIHIHREHELWIILAIRIIELIQYGKINIKKILYTQHILPRKHRYLIYLANTIITPSNYIKQALLSKYKSLSTQHIHIIHPICSLDINTQNTIQKSSPSQYKILLSGALYKFQYILDEILQDISNQPDLSNNIHLYIASPSSSQQDKHIIHNILLKYPHIESTLLEHKQRMEYLNFVNNNIDIYIHTFTKEAFGISVYEVATLNKPIIAVSGGGSDEIVEVYSQAYKCSTHRDIAKNLTQYIYTNQTNQTIQPSKTNKINKQLFNKKFNVKTEFAKLQALYSTYYNQKNSNNLKH